MRRALRPFLAPLVLIGLLCALLLALDPGAPGSRKGPPRVALVQHAQIAALDAGASGIVARLAERGFVDGRTVRLTRYDAQSDLATANDIARQVTGGQFDLVVTVSTLSLQTVANSNRERRVPHVFGVVTDAASAGVGVSATDPTDHPEWLTGYTSLVPAGKALALARELNPGLRKVGLVWHSSEVSSQTYTRDARAAAATLGLELLEANAENPGEVGLGARALVERGAEKFLLTGDVIVLSAAEVLIQVARDARIPVISMIPPNAKKGALADLGADYATVGREVGDRAADVLQGAVIAKLPVLNRAPLAFTLNLDALRGLRSGWSAPADVVARADVVIDQAGEHRRGAAAASPAAAVPGPARSPSPSSPPPSSVTAPSGATTDAR